MKELLRLMTGYNQHTSPNFPKPTPILPNTTPILNVPAQMINNGRSEYSVKFVRKALTYLSKHADLNQPEQVKQYIAAHPSNAYKRNLAIAYNKYVRYYNLQWEMPLYKPDAKTIKIPTNEKIEKLIAGAGRTLAIKLTLSKETGLRPVELHNLKVKDIDLDQRAIHPTTAKNGSARTLKISNNLQAMLTRHINDNNLNPNDKLFKDTAEGYGKHYRLMRASLAKKLQDPTLATIRLYDFRHYYATTLYSKTRDILLVKQQMGHKKIETTLIYTQLLNLNDDEWTCKTAKNVTEATSLVEAGFGYVTEIDQNKLFRKRK